MLSCYGVKTLSQRPQRRLEGGPRTLPPRPEKDENAEWSFCVLVILWVGRRQTGRVKAGRPPFTGLKLAESLD